MSARDPQDGTSSRSFGEPAVVVRPGHLPRSSFNLPEVTTAEEAKAEPLSFGANVVPFVRLRGAAPIAALDAGARPAPSRIIPESRTLWAGLILVSVLLHGGVFALLQQRPEPLASAGIKAINVELWIGADTVAGTAATAGESAAQSVASVEPETVATEVTPSRQAAAEREAATAAPQNVPVAQPEAAPVAAATKAKPVAEADAKPAAAIDDARTAQADKQNEPAARDESAKSMNTATAVPAIRMAAADRAEAGAPVQPTSANASEQVSKAAAAQPDKLAAEVGNPTTARRSEQALVAAPAAAPTSQSASLPSIALREAATVEQPSAITDPSMATVMAVAPAAKAVPAAKPATEAQARPVPATTASAKPEMQNLPARAAPVEGQPVDTVWNRQGSAVAQAAERIPAERLSPLTAPSVRPDASRGTAVAVAEPEVVADDEPDDEAAPVQTTSPPLRARERHRIAGPSTNRRTTPRHRASRPAIASAGGIGIGRSDLYSTYAGVVAARLARFKRFPEEAWRRGEEGTATVVFLVDGFGYVTSVWLVDGSGSPSIDREAESMVYRASPFPAPPERRGMRITAPISFHLQ